MNLECLKGIITNGLAVHIDISDEKSWDLNTGFTSVSLNKWSGAQSSDLELLDFGLTAYDNGRVDSKLDNLNIDPNDLKLTLYRIGNNNATGGTFFDQYPISAVTTGSSVGNFFSLNGGYLQGFFKLEDYDFEQLPQRFNEGITIENIININEDSEGIFYYMGARAEDKYNPFFSGETKEVLTEKTVVVKTGIFGFSSERKEFVTSFSGVTTSKGNNLMAHLEETDIKNAFNDYADRLETKFVQQPQDSINSNVIAFGIDSDKRMFIKRVNENGNVTVRTSPNVITSTGWTIINKTFKPDGLIDPDCFEELKECLPARNGTLTISIDGRKFWEIKDYKEFFFVGIKNNKEKQIGVPYNISWGGGSFGLKHSWHYDLKTYILYDGNDTMYINNNFELKENPLKDDPCDDILDIADPNISGLLFSADTETFAMVDDTCDPPIETPITVFRIEETGTTAQTVGNQYFIEYVPLIDVLSNRDYVISTRIFENSIFKFGSSKLIKLVVYGTEDIEILEERVYNGRESNSWFDLSLKFKLKENTDLQQIKIGLLIDSNQSLNENFILFVDDLKYTGSDVLSQDSRKNNLTIENNFDSSYIGDIQKLRIYTIPFDSRMVLHNAKKEFSDPVYRKTIKGGGRIINV